MIAALFTLFLAVPVDDLSPPPVVDERPALIDPAGDRPPEPPPPVAEPVPEPLLPAAPTTTKTKTPTPDAKHTVAVSAPNLDGFAVPSIMGGALIGGGATAGVGVLFVASAYEVISLGTANEQSRAFSELMGWALLASAPAMAGLAAGAIALLFLDGAGLDDWASLALCTTMAWVGSLAVVAMLALGVSGGAGLGCNPNGCNPGGCGPCGNSCGRSHNDGDLMDDPANLVAAGAVFGAFAGGAIGATVTFFNVDPNDPRISLYLAAGSAAGAAIGAPIGAAIPAFGID